MKKLIFTIAAGVILSATSCSSDAVTSTIRKFKDDITTSANPDTTIIASENIVTVTKDIKQFSELKNNIVADVTYIQNEDAPKIVITGPDNIIDLVLIIENDSNLTLNFPEGLKIKREEDLKIAINSKEINEITNNGVGDFCAENLHSNKIKIINNGVGDLKISKVSTTELIIKNNGVGDITLSGNAGKADIGNHGVGDIKIGDFKAKELKKENKGVGKIK